MYIIIITIHNTDLNLTTNINKSTQDFCQIDNSQLLMQYITEWLNGSFDTL